MPILGIVNASKSNFRGVAGYVAGGSNGTVRVTRVDKITFPADTKTTLSATLTGIIYHSAGFANSGVAGYVAGGATLTDRIDKITFPADTKTTLSAVLTVAVTRCYGFADSGVL